MTKLTKPISIADISRTTGVGSPYLGYLITHGSINKWAKFKPVAHNSWGVLSEADFKGNRVNEGIIYGIKVSCGHTFNDIHDTTFEYVRPRGIEYNEPFRERDFDGYNSEATCTLTGSFLATVLVPSGEGLKVTIHSNDYADAVPFHELVKADGATLGLTDCYPFLMVGRYCTRLVPEGGTFGKFTQGGGTYVASLTNLGSHIIANTSYKVTAFLCADTDGQLRRAIDASSTGWVDTWGMRWSAFAYPVPEATGIEMKIPTNPTLGVSTYYTTRTGGAGIKFQPSSTNTSGFTFSADITITSLITSSGSHDARVDGITKKRLTNISPDLVYAISWAEMGVSGTINTGDTYTMHVDWKTLNGYGTAVESGSLDLTGTVLASAPR